MCGGVTNTIVLAIYSALKRNSRGKEDETLSSFITCSVGPITNFSSYSYPYTKESDYSSHGLRQNIKFLQWDTQVLMFQPISVHNTNEVPPQRPSALVSGLGFNHKIYLSIFYCHYMPSYLIVQCLYMSQDSYS